MAAYIVIVTCPSCSEKLETKAVIESVLCQDDKIKVNFGRQEVSHECSMRKSRVENAGS